MFTLTNNFKNLFVKAFKLSSPEVVSSAHHLGFT
ncbi:MAG: hypothetical protein ACI9XO_003763 [Paraglaciecola sp.]|jgi:hypothetical protein